MHQLQPDPWPSRLSPRLWQAPRIPQIATQADLPPCPSNSHLTHCPINTYDRFTSQLRYFPGSYRSLSRFIEIYCRPSSTWTHKRPASRWRQDDKNGPARPKATTLVATGTYARTNPSKVATSRRKSQKVTPKSTKVAKSRAQVVESRSNFLHLPSFLFPLPVRFGTVPAAAGTVCVCPAHIFLVS
jgi:hypothetical protein